jgi:hypothetical protein
MRRRMQKRQLKRLIETGHYRPQPEQIAEAMLERRGVRELLIGGLSFNTNGGPPFNPADRIQSPSAVPRQAA